METNKSVFISHIVDEAPVADALKTYLQRCFGPKIPVFVSSDYDSIATGDEWYRAIIGAITGAGVVVVLLSRDSIDRRWINFESGLAIGANIKFQPLTIRGLSAADVGLPLSQFHLRALVDELALEGNIRMIAESIAAPPERIEGTREFVVKLAEIEDTLPVKSIILEPVLEPQAGQSYSQLRFRLSNTGNRDVELIEIEVSIPKIAVIRDWDPRSQEITNVLSAEWRKVEEAEHLFMWEKPFGGTLDRPQGKRRPLPRIISPHWTPRLSDFLRVPVRNDIEMSGRCLVRYKVVARGLYTEPGRKGLREIPVLE